MAFVKIKKDNAYKAFSTTRAWQTAGALIIIIITILVFGI